MKIISHAKIFHLICLDREKVTRKLVTVAHTFEIHSLKRELHSRF